MRQFLLASPRAGVGKTTAAINLATAAAFSGARVLLADCDPAGGAIAALGLGAPSATLAAVAADSPAPFWRDAVPGLDVTTPYGDPAQPAHTLDEFLALVARDPAFRLYSVILYDTPPVLAGSQMASLLRAADDAVLVLRAEPTAFKDVSPFLKLLKRIQDEGAPVQFGGLTRPSGGGTSGSATTDYANFCCPAYLSEMKDLIERNWNQNQGMSGLVGVKFTIRRDGTLTDVKIEKPSGSDMLDLESQRAILKTRQLAPLPREFTEPTLTVHLIFEYHRS